MGAEESRPVDAAAPAEADGGGIVVVSEAQRAEASEQQNRDVAAIQSQRQFAPLVSVERSGIFSKDTYKLLERVDPEALRQLSQDYTAWLHGMSREVSDRQAMLSQKMNDIELFAAKLVYLLSAFTSDASQCAGSIEAIDGLNLAVEESQRQLREFVDVAERLSQLLPEGNEPLPPFSEFVLVNEKIRRQAARE